ncbi:efflux RND transporter periplasmic adaptor subunit [Novipirellula artificiosorum]|uniref:Cation efflux system protein CusB n=1 Tax=Novipirellula artificiosorum TaxID=2528016 RepID=A0A5C6DDQ1_9BACT|nr:efflux RND transporter periplasmic adaptor subunit [Novipirellula artificiosorum]TWU34872.1 Cation efflux system protein CusB precursor [Novipirellula artificiosorum]
MKDLIKRHQRKLWIAQAVAFAVIGFAIAWSLRGPSTPSGDSTTASTAAPTADAEPAIWTCSMHPQIRRDGPGDCPICGMDLVPVKKSVGGVRTVSISSDVKKLMNVQTVPVTRRYVTANVRMVGKIDYDETSLAHITAWVSGRLDRLYVDYTGVRVNKGDHMAYIYSEELYTAQEELITAVESDVNRPTSRFIESIDLAESAREKLRLLGITEKQIQEIEQRRKPTDHITIYSPVGGIVIEKLRQEGDRVRTGDRIYTVADLTKLWVQMDAYESDLAWLRYGQEVEFTTEAYPGEVFKGRVAFINPVLNEATRTVKVRVNVSNEDGRLKPEMFVRAIVRSKIAAGGRVLDASLAGKWIGPMHPEIVKDEPGDCPICGMPLVKAETLGYVTAEPSDAAKPLVIPVSAALLTGTRAIVYLQIPDAEQPTYEGREIVLGPRAGDYYLVKAGLEEGDLVVTNGNFKLDSALQISAKPSMMTPEGGGGGGHDHGGGSKTSAGGEAMAGHSGMSLPAKLEAQLHQTVGAVDAIGQSIEEADLERIREAFKKLGLQVAAVDANPLSSDMKAQWREFAMLLNNDAVEGQDILTLQPADRIYLVTKRHAERLTKMFGLAHAGHDMAEMPLEVPVEFRTELTRLLPPYLAIGEALSSDDANAAMAAVDGLHKAVSSINAESLKEKAAERWTAERNSLSTIAARLANATDLDSLRSAFALLSDELLTLQRSFGIQFDQPLFELHCPMAFDGRGASWVQTDDKVRNPYYGKSMLKCADKVEKL